MSIRTRHPFSGALYELGVDGNIRVTDRGKEGVFTISGQWVSGALKQCDPQLCVWVGHTDVDQLGESAASVAVPRRIN